VTIEFAGKKGEIALDQLRTVDKSRLVRRLGMIEESIARRVLSAIAEMFA
jgi:mRNA interferase MazF